MWKWKETSTRDFCRKLSEKNPDGCFQNLATFCKWFSGENKGKNNNITWHSSRSDISTLLTLLSADVCLRVPSLSKVEVRNFPLLYFPKWLCMIHGQCAMSLRCVKRLVMCKCKCFCLFEIQQFSVSSWVLFSPSQKVTLKEIQLSVNCCVSILNFHLPKF